MIALIRLRSVYAVAESTMLAIELCACNEVCLSGLNRHGLGHVAIDTRIQWNMGDDSLKRQWRIGNGNGWVSIGEPYPAADRQQQESYYNSQQQTHHLR